MKKLLRKRKSKNKIKLPYKLLREKIPLAWNKDNGALIYTLWVIVDSSQIPPTGSSSTLLKLSTRLHPLSNLLKSQFYPSQFTQISNPTPQIQFPF